MEKIRIAIVEDEAVILKAFTRYVEQMGHEIAGISLNGIDAINMIESMKPDMVLIDLNLPGKDGITVINEACIEKMIPTVIITGHYSRSIIDRVNIPCVYGYLMKPVRAAQVKAGIEIAWSRHKENSKAMLEAEEYRVALENRKYIEQAKGILMDEFGLKESEAMKRLQRLAQNKKKKISDVAKEMISTYKELPH